MAMSTGVYSGWLMYPSSYFAYKYHEPAPNYTLIGFGAMGGAAVITMNHNSFQRLPTEIQEIITEVGREYEIWASELLDERQSQGLRDLQNSGAFVRTLSEEARRGWAESLVDFPNSMAQEANSRGLPGSEILNTYIALIDESGYQFPVSYTIE